MINKSNSRSGTPNNRVKDIFTNGNNDMNNTIKTNFNSTNEYNHSDMDITQKQN